MCSKKQGKAHGNNCCFQTLPSRVTSCSFFTLYTYFLPVDIYSTWNITKKKLTEAHSISVNSIYSLDIDIDIDIDIDTDTDIDILYM